MEAMDPSENPNHASLIKSLGLSNAQLAQAASFTNTKYPNLDLEFELEDPDSVTANAPAHLQIKIEREVDDDDDDADEKKEPDTTVHAPFYPQRKTENWWLVCGEEKTGSLLAIKRVTIARRLEVRLEFVVPTPGEYDLTLYLMSDSYVGVDQDPRFKVMAADGMDEDEDEEEEDGE